MNCAESYLFLHAHADGELDVAKSLELERHLKTCSACAPSVRRYGNRRCGMTRPIRCEGKSAG